MGDFRSLSEPWMPLAPRALPLGKANVYPQDDVSLPTWALIIGLSRKEEFYLNKPVRDLTDAVCTGSRSVTSPSLAWVIQTVRFVMPLESNWGSSTTHWANFTTVLFPCDLKKQAMPIFQTLAHHKRSRCQRQQSVMSTRSVDSSMREIKTFLEQLATSEQPGQPAVDPDDIFLYPNGMNVIYALSEGLASFAADSTVAAWMVDILRGGPWARKYAKSGQQIRARFNELPSNINLSSPNLHHIHALADKYGFIVACDDTVAGYVNTFSGFSNVTGGSLVINPSPRHRQTLHTITPSQYENIYFPLDVEVLAKNSKNISWRVQQCNKNTLPVKLLQSHPSVAQVNHPSIAPTEPVYRSLMRKDGGYGNVLSIIFHHPRSAEHFYDVLDICKGSSFGTNFTLAVPYVQLANYWNREKVPTYGVPQHIIRINVGLEDSEGIVNAVAAALREVERLESGDVLLGDA
ncbi:pyridoxal phosphate-dependent transferase [Aspergillus transmontanensis]|uniref:Pyridoxal phosphate-dependent transferase n=1 Tax=Aspergillus transmontanensis TaxID=1034304 RepID=A0A5N6VL44_9EURO|nr:pyridoxal phosphate-dependent transferase [Aspergillus transmontanensis]